MLRFNITLQALNHTRVAEGSVREFEQVYDGLLYFDARSFATGLRLYRLKIFNLGGEVDDTVEHGGAGQRRVEVNGEEHGEDS